MPRLRAPAISALIALLGLALPAYAAPAPIVFDFEDGLQGWELVGAATRVQTQVLGGEWAIFGDGAIDQSGEFPFVATAISFGPTDEVTGFSSLSVEALFVGDVTGLTLLVGINLIDNIFVAVLDSFEPAVSGGGKVWTVDVLPARQSFTIVWAALSTLPDGTVVEEPVVAFIDNITFHPVPEPGSLALLAFSLGAILIAQRRIG